MSVIMSATGNVAVNKINIVTAFDEGSLRPTRKDGRCHDRTWAKELARDETWCLRRSLETIGEDVPGSKTCSEDEKLFGKGSRKPYL